MQDTRKLLGGFILFAFVLIAGSVVCLASGEPSAMTDCGNQMHAAALCPFMSVSLPSVAAAVGKEAAIVIALALIFIAFTGVLTNDRREALALAQYHSPHTPPSPLLDPTLRLISRGILHTKVFGF